ncbi:S1C family serine protease [Haloarculaceae archaeon H-GB2-1]|nr:S1C family serine protease [Haloarculaceae archaeon H-GB1-1]MEA5406600.1 S1C family serine protease [Haloarculaceae archaeon H-GB2-1]
MILNERKVDSWYRATTPIKYPGVDGHSTGFFYMRKGEPYLITNRHAFYDIHQDGSVSFQPERIVIRIRSDHTDPSITNSHSINLYENGNPRWLEHPNFHIDVAGIPLDLDWDSNKNTSFAGGGHWSLPTSENIDDEYGILSPEFGDSAVVMGYPIIDTTDYLPVLRNALIASQYGRFQRDEPYFLIDANLHEGTSGSPVIYNRRNSKGQKEAHLLGIHSGPFDLSQRGSENLNRVWYRKTILGLFGEFPVQHTVDEF